MRSPAPLPPYVVLLAEYYAWDISEVNNLKMVKTYLNNLPENLLIRFFYGMLSAIDTLHSSGIIYREIKADNFLISNNLMPSISSLWIFIIYECIYKFYH